MEQFPISGLLSGTPFRQMVGGPVAFDGSLWTLRYDLAFYAVIAVLIGTAVLRRAPRAVVLLAAVCYLFVLRDLFTSPEWTARPPQRGAIGPIPLIGSFAADWTLRSTNQASRSALPPGSANWRVSVIVASAVVSACGLRHRRHQCARRAGHPGAIA